MKMILLLTTLLIGPQMAMANDTHLADVQVKSISENSVVISKKLRKGEKFGDSGLLEIRFPFQFQFGRYWLPLCPQSGSCGGWRPADWSLHRSSVFRWV